MICLLGSSPMIYLTKSYPEDMGGELRLKLAIGKIVSLIISQGCLVIFVVWSMFLCLSSHLIMDWLSFLFWATSVPKWSLMIVGGGLWVQFSCSVMSDSLLPHEPSTPGLPVHYQLPEHTQTHVHWVGDAIQPSHPLLSPSPPALNLSQHQGLFKWVSPLHQVAKVLEFQLQHQSFQWTPRTDLLQDDWLDLLAVQGTLKSLLQHHNSKASILWHSAFFTVQLSHPYMTTGKTIALTRRTFVGKVMSLLFNMLSRLVITFLPRNKRLLISWLQSCFKKNFIEMQLIYC